MHPDHERYVKACEYPGELDEAAVERHLGEYLKALGVERKIVRLPVGWSLEKFPALKSYIEEVLAEFVKRAPAQPAARAARDAMDARDAMAAMAAMAARDARDARDARAARAARAARDAFYPALSEYVLSVLRELPVKVAA